MAFRNPSGGLDDFEFTFESYLEDADRAPSDMNYSVDDEVETEPLSDNVVRFPEENGRTYHAYHAGSYYFPNDATERERLEDQHDIFKLILDGRNFLAPLSRENPPRRILDVGTGTGTWAIDMGDDFPSAQVIGTDLSPIQPNLVPPNVQFLVDDSSEEWDWAEPFDFIHTRATLGCWSDMQAQVVRRAFANLRPGGWLECQELLLQPACDDGTMPPDHGFLAWADDLRDAAARADRQLYLGPDLARWMVDAGFVDVQQLVFKIPLSDWPKELWLRQLGTLWQQNLLSGLRGFALALLHRVYGRSVEDIEVSLVDTRRALLNQSVHAYHQLYVVFGRKPEQAPGETMAQPDTPAT